MLIAIWSNWPPRVESSWSDSKRAWMPMEAGDWKPVDSSLVSWNHVESTYQFALQINPWSKAGPKPAHELPNGPRGVNVKGYLCGEVPLAPTKTKFSFYSNVNHDFWACLGIKQFRFFMLFMGKKTASQPYQIKRFLSFPALQLIAATPNTELALFVQSFGWRFQQNSGRLFLNERIVVAEKRQDTNDEKEENQRQWHCKPPVANACLDPETGLYPEPFQSLLGVHLLSTSDQV